MNSEKLHSWVTLCANLGVIAGIIFLAVEIAQNNELLAAQDRFNRLTVSQHPGTMTVADPELRRILLKAPIEQLDLNEQIAFSAFWDQVFTGWQWTFNELEFDELPIERFRDRFNRSSSTLPTWNATKFQYEKEFVEFVEEFIVGN